MKKMYISALIICATLTASAQFSGTVKYKPTACAENLMESYRRLAARSGLKSCFPGIYSVTGYMQAGCYSFQKDSGHVTFGSYLVETSGGSTFHTTWDSARLGYDYYGVCYPSVIVWDVPRDYTTLNHVYEAYLINTADYQPALVKTFDALKSKAIKSDQITQLISWSYETSTGWTATKESANYNNLYSSKGLTVTVKLKSGKTITCYLLNNYDGAGTIVWKTPMSLTVAAVAPNKNIQTDNIKLVSSMLQQNQPNPANSSTYISYSLPDKFNTAKIKFTDYLGNTVKEATLSGAGNGSLNVDVHNLNAGTYKYALYIDGVMAESKTMMVVK
ncbi:MAG TPA: hypothetical protein PL045_03970 [Chitinophagaceae bacterium]|nr:hypothetical protein [Chitinophagaceae bacterium]